MNETGKSEKLLNKRVLGLDFGEKTIGVAVSDGLGLIANGVTVIRRNNENDLKASINEVSRYAAEYGVGTVVVGLPKNMNNTSGDRCEKTNLFCGKLKKALSGINIEMFDERLTTAAAERILLEADMSRKKRGQIIDKMAAMQILQGYLDMQNARKKREEMEMLNRKE